MNAIFFIIIRKRNNWNMQGIFLYPSSKAFWCLVKIFNQTRFTSKLCLECSWLFLALCDHYWTTLILREKNYILSMWTQNILAFWSFFQRYQFSSSMILWTIFWTSMLSPIPKVGVYVESHGHASLFIPTFL